MQGNKLKWAQEICACPCMAMQYYGIVHGHIHGDRTRAAQRRLALSVIVKIRTLQTLVLGNQNNKNSDK